MMTFIEIKRTAIFFLVFCLLLVAACAPQKTNEELMASIAASVHKSWRRGVAAGTVDYTASVYESLRAGENDEAVAQCVELREIRPNDPVIYIAEGYAYQLKREYPAAISRYTSAIATGAAGGGAYLLRAESYWQLDEYEKALEDLSQIIDSEKAPVQIAQFYNDVFGVNTYGKAFALRKVFNTQALAYSALGETNLAIASGSKAIEYDSGNATLYENRGTYFFATQQYGAAYNDFEKTIALESDRSKAWKSTGVINLILGNYNKAVIQFQKAHELDPDNVDTLSTYSLAYWLQGNQVKAFELMGKVLRGEPDSSTYYHLAYFNHLSGHQEKALEYYKNASELDNDILKNRASIVSYTPASSPTREFYEDELANATIYIETGKTPKTIAHASRAPQFEITGITFDPNPVPLNKPFDFNVRFDVDVPGSSDDNIPTSLSFQILRGGKTLLTSESYTINADNGGSKKWTLHMNPVRKKGTYTIRVTIEYKNLVNEKAVELRIN